MTAPQAQERRVPNRNSQIYEASGANKLMESELRRLKGASPAAMPSFLLRKHAHPKVFSPAQRTTRKKQRATCRTSPMLPGDRLELSVRRRRISLPRHTIRPTPNTSTRLSRRPPTSPRRHTVPVCPLLLARALLSKRNSVLTVYPACLSSPSLLRAADADLIPRYPCVLSV